MASQTGSATHEQVDTLLNFLEEHKDLARGRLRSIEGKVQAKRLWNEICNTLNSMGGCTKTVQQWQKVWSDKKYLAKRAATDSNKSASATGGGPSTTPPLSQWIMKIVSIMGDGFGGRQTGARVPAFDETEPVPSNINQASVPSTLQASVPSTVQESDSYIHSQDSMPSTSGQASLSLPLSFDADEVHEYHIVEVNQSSQLQPVNPQVSHEARSRPSSSTRHRRRQSGPDVRTRLFQYEELRVERGTVRNRHLAGIREELADIKAILLQLSGQLTQYLNRE